MDDLYLNRLLEIQFWAALLALNSPEIHSEFNLPDTAPN